jgi:lipopolysaccharide biosynthesis protein
MLNSATDETNNSYGRSYPFDLPCHTHTTKEPSFALAVGITWSQRMLFNLISFFNVLNSLPIVVKTVIE